MRHPERNCHNDEGLIKRGIARRGRVCLFERSREGEGGREGGVKLDDRKTSRLPAKKRGKKRTGRNRARKKKE